MFMEIILQYILSLTAIINSVKTAQIAKTEELQMKYIQVTIIDVVKNMTEEILKKNIDFTCKLTSASKMTILPNILNHKFEKNTLFYTWGRLMEPADTADMELFLSSKSPDTDILILFVKNIKYVAFNQKVFLHSHEYSIRIQTRIRIFDEPQKSYIIFTIVLKLNKKISKNTDLKIANVSINESMYPSGYNVIKSNRYNNTIEYQNDLFLFFSISKIDDDNFENITIKIDMNYDYLFSENGIETNKKKKIKFSDFKILDNSDFEDDYLKVNVNSSVECDVIGKFTVEGDIHRRSLPDNCAKLIIVSEEYQNTSGVCRSAKTQNCSNYQCENGGTCKFDSNNNTQYPICVCQAGFFGPTCQYKSRCGNCKPQKCINYNECDECRIGWGGDNCKQRVCENFDWCYNNGTCKLENGSRLCECTKNYYGRYCEMANETKEETSTIAMDVSSTTTLQNIDISTETEHTTKVFIGNTSNVNISKKSKGKEFFDDFDAEYNKLKKFISTHWLLIIIIISIIIIATIGIGFCTSYQLKISKRGEIANDIREPNTTVPNHNSVKRVNMESSQNKIFKHKTCVVGINEGGSNWE